VTKPTAWTIVVGFLAVLCFAWPAVTSGEEPEPRALGVAPPVDPVLNQSSAAKVRLGRELFFDKRLSRDNSISCASCHDPNAGFADPHAQSAGTRGRLTRRHSPSVLNAYVFEALGSLMWDGRAHTLEQQALMPFDEKAEFDLPVEEATRKLQRYGYAPKFQEAFGTGVAADELAKAIAAYERSLSAGASPFDRYALGGEKDAISGSAERGFQVFLRSSCNACHLVDVGELHPFAMHFVSFSDGQFHNLGIGSGDGAKPGDLGRFEITGDPKDKGRFKTPTLRNVASTAPYFHDGSAVSLTDVIEVYDRGGFANPNLDPVLRPLHLSEIEKRELATFLASLTSPRVAALANEEARILEPLAAAP
jgi:cytochrome c peroxidase